MKSSKEDPKESETPEENLQQEQENPESSVQNQDQESIAESDTTDIAQADEPQPEPVANQSDHFISIIEALLFATDEPLTIPKLRSILPGRTDARKIKSALDEINKRLAEGNHPFECVEVAGGYQLRTNPTYHRWIKQLFKEKINRRLSQSGLETLAIIAYKQPITKAEVETIRGVIADGAMKTLLERRLIEIAGRSEKPGRPLLYQTTKDFLKYFGLRHLDDLPKLEEFEEMAKAKAAEEIQAEAPATVSSEDLGDERDNPEESATELEESSSENDTDENPPEKE